MQASPREWDRRLPFDKPSPALPDLEDTAPGFWRFRASLTQAIGTSHPSGAGGKPRSVVESPRVGALSRLTPMRRTQCMAKLLLQFSGVEQCFDCAARSSISSSSVART
jgi:hypothetical protein